MIMKARNVLIRPAHDRSPSASTTKRTYVHDLSTVSRRLLELVRDVCDMVTPADPLAHKRVDRPGRSSYCARWLAILNSEASSAQKRYLRDKGIRGDGHAANGRGLVQA